MDKTVLITGANGGIGGALCKIFKESKWRVFGSDIYKKPNEYCDHFFQEDISQSHAVTKIRDILVKKQIALKCLINNAAIQIEKRMIHTTEEEWNTVFQNNVGSIFLTTKILFDLFRGGSIINISSVHARATSKGMAAYVASKGAISALTRAMALELAEYNIRVNAILPGAIDTAMLRKGLDRNGNADNALNKIIYATPLNRIGIPEDVANLALFLADDKQAANITGQEFICDGGVLARLGSE